MASADGDHADAARMIGFTDSACAAVGQVPGPDDAGELATVRAAAVAASGGDEFAGRYAAGAGLDASGAFGLDGE